MKTLVIVDALYDFMPGGSLEVPDGNEIVPVINKIMDKFDLVVATQDWHPPEHMSFASNHEGKKPFDTIDDNGMEQILWPDHCVQGSKGAEFHKDLKTNPLEAVFRKGMDPKIDSYSGFYDNHHLKKTGLAGYLREKGAEKLYFCGLAADICVYFSIKDAVKEGFASSLITDATKPLKADDYEKQKKEYAELDVDLIESSDI